MQLNDQTKNEIQEDNNNINMVINKTTKVNLDFVKYNKIAFNIIGFYIGLQYFYDLPTMFFIKDYLKAQPGSYSEIAAVSTLPWNFKPLFGLFSDFLPIFGSRRKVYLYICSISMCFIWIYWVLYNESLQQSMILLLLYNFFSCFTSVISDAIIVETSKEISKYTSMGESDLDTKNIISTYVQWKNIGLICSSFMKTFVIMQVSLKDIFIICACIQLFAFIGALFVQEKGYNSFDIENNSDEEEPLVKEDSKQENDITFWGFLCRKIILIPLFFIISYCSTPGNIFYLGADDPMFYFMTIKLQFTAETLGIISFLSYVFSLLAIFIYQTFLINRTYSYIVIMTTLMSFLFTFLQYLMVIRYNQYIYLSDFFCCLFSSSFNFLLAELAALPLYSLACLLCPPKLEASVYGIFSSACNIGGTISNIETSYLVRYYGITNDDFSNLKDLVLITNIFSLSPLLLLLIIDNKYFEVPKNSENKKIDKPNT